MKTYHIYQNGMFLDRVIGTKIILAENGIIVYNENIVVAIVSTTAVIVEQNQ